MSGQIDIFFWTFFQGAFGQFANFPTYQHTQDFDCAITVTAFNLLQGRIQTGSKGSHKPVKQFRLKKKF